MQPRLSLLILLISTLLVPLAGSLHAQKDPVDVRNVKFNKNAGNWKDTLIEVELVANGNPNPDAPNPKYVDNIGVTLTIGYAHPNKDGEFIFHSSSVVITTLEVAKSRKIGFWLPYDIVERDNVAKEPKFWYVDVEIDGSPIAPTGANIRARASSDLQNPTALNSFQNKASDATEGVLLPGYLSGNGYIERGKDRPAFIRKEEN
ncbi:MAG: hypothetical protein AAFX93_05080 [Verrucomicrobiota bacterium]